MKIIRSEDVNWCNLRRVASLARRVLMVREYGPLKLTFRIKSVNRGTGVGSVVVKNSPDEFPGTKVLWHEGKIRPNDIDLLKGNSTLRFISDLGDYGTKFIREHRVVVHFVSRTTIDRIEVVPSHHALATLGFWNDGLPNIISVATQSQNHSKGEHDV